MLMLGCIHAGVYPEAAVILPFGHTRLCSCGHGSDLPYAIRIDTATFAFWVLCKVAMLHGTVSIESILSTVPHPALIPYPYLY